MSDADSLSRLLTTMRARSDRISPREALEMDDWTVLGEGLAIPTVAHHRILTPELWRERVLQQQGARHDD